MFGSSIFISFSNTERNEKTPNLSQIEAFGSIYIDGPVAFIVILRLYLLK